MARNIPSIAIAQAATTDGAPVITIISGAERVAERRGVKAVIVGPPGVGKTSLLRELDPQRVLFIEAESGDFAVRDVKVDTVHLNDWSTARDLACRIGGPNPSYGPTACYSQAHFDAIGGPLENLDRYETYFVDSITAIGRLSYRWAEQQPETFSRSGQKDVRATYGLHAREMIAWLSQLQRIHDRNMIFVAVLEKITDAFNLPTWQIQLEGARTGRELPGIVDEIITMQFVDFGDGKPVRAFVCTAPNPWNYRAKDRSGRLEQVEEPNLGKLIKKLTQT